MEKIKKSYYKEYPILRIFKQDLKEIADLFGKNSEIIADEYKLNNISEIDNINKKEITNIKFTMHEEAKNIYMYLELSERKATIFSRDDDDLYVLGIISKIDSILSKRINKKLDLLASNWIVLPSILVYIIARYSIEFMEIKIQTIIFSLFSFILYIALAIWGYKVKTKKYSLIYLFDSPAPGFIERNKDNIILSIISAILGGIITTIFQR